MGRDISISISAKDNFTATIAKVKTATSGLGTSLDGLSQKLEALNKTRASLTVDVTKAKAELNSAKKAFDGTRESADRLEKAQLDYSNLTSSLNYVNSKAKEAEKAYLALSNAAEKANSSMEKPVTSGLSASTESSAQPSTNIQSGGSLTTSNFQWSTVTNSELVKDITATVEKKAIATISSQYGEDTANAVSSAASSALSGLTSGAAIGSMIAPGIGTAIGAAVGTVAGGVTGYISSSIDVDQKLDDYFKETYQTSYENMVSDYQDKLSEGITTAASREQTELAFETLLGAKGKMLDWTSWMQEFASATPFSYEDLTSMSKTAFSYKFTTKDTKTLMQAIGDAGSALGLSGSDLTNVATYLGRMNSTDKVTLEYLNPLVERGIPAIDYIAEAMSERDEDGKTWTVADVYDAVSDGTLDGSEMVVEILEKMEEDFSGSMEKQSQTYDGLTSTLEDTMTELNTALGNGYNDVRKESLQDQIDFYGGDSGSQMQEAYNLIGQWQASMDNLQDQLKMDALAEVMDGEEFKEAVASGTNEGAAEAGRMLAEALAEAEAEYTQTEGYDLMVQTQTGVIEGVRTELSASNYQAGYELGQEFTKGYQAALATLSAEKSAVYYATTPSATEVGGHAYSTNVTYLDDPLAGSTGGSSRAVGLSYVPYNDFPARLHEGERVMTAEENREYTSGKSSGIVITGNNFNVRNDSDIEKIGEQIYQQLLKAQRLRA